MANILNNSNISKKEKNDKEKKFKNYYILKCLCIVSVYPFLNRLEEISRPLHYLVLSYKYINLPIDRIIEKIIVEKQKLPREYKKIYLRLSNKIIDLTENRMNDYHNININ